MSEDKRDSRGGAAARAGNERSSLKPDGPGLETGAAKPPDGPGLETGAAKPPAEPPAPYLAKLLEEYQAETAALSAELEDGRKLAAALLGRLIALGVDDLKRAWRAETALRDMLKSFEYQEHCKQRPAE